MLKKLDSLIDKVDTFELVRDQIALILLLESTNQHSLALAAGKKDDFYNVRIFTERANPFNDFQNIDTDPDADKRPIININYENSNFPLDRGNVVEKQTSESSFNIDMFACAISESKGSAGHIPGDEAAAKALHAVIRLVRNILMSALNTYLQLRGTVTKRWPQSINMFQPDQNQNTVQNVIAARMILTVDFGETSQQIAGEALEVINNSIKRAEDGSIVLSAEYDFTA